ncbi:hypothetical protein BGZ54_006467 [Gamsiella multidivaricata]|nr:hypothetical protein BGZ54_006467 [Gamsiella multidivaricata]
MRPDPHKQAASRKYHNKVRSRGGGVAGTAVDPNASSAGHRGGRGGSGGGARGGRGGGRGGYRGRSNDSEQKEDEDEGVDSDDAPRKSYARRKIVSNADRYIERNEEVTEAEELEQGIDRQTIAFRDMLKDSDQKKTFDPAAYFRFKSEKDVDTQDPMESQQARKLLEIRLNDIEKALMALSIKERLNLRDTDAQELDRDMLGKVSMSTGRPIVPKLVRGQAASDILIKPTSAATGITSSPSNTPTGYNKAAQGMQEAAKQAMDDDLDELLDITKTYGSARPSTAALPKIAASSSILSTRLPAASKSTESTSSEPKARLPPLLSKGTRTVGTSGTSTPKGLPPLKRIPPRSGGKNDEEWLDSVLGI